MDLFDQIECIERDNDCIILCYTRQDIENYAEKVLTPSQWLELKRQFNKTIGMGEDSTMNLLVSIAREL